MRAPVALLALLTVAPMLLGLGCSDTPTSPSPLFELALSPSAVAAGAASVGVVRLRGRTRQVIRIDLSSSDAVASVPSSILVPAGTAVAEFTVRTRLVAADTVARILASAGGTKQEIALRVVAPIVRPTTLETPLEMTPTPNEAAYLCCGSSAARAVLRPGREANMRTIPISTF